MQNPFKLLQKKTAPLPNYAIFDIDGVFNPHMATDLIERNFLHYTKGWIDWHLDIVNHAAWLREIDDLAEIVWGSNWYEESNALAGWFHLRKLEYPHIPLKTARVRTDLEIRTDIMETWKLPAISAWVEKNVSDQQKVVWVEDEIFEDAHIWAAKKPNVLLIQTDPAIGFTKKQFEAAREFLTC